MDDHLSGKDVGELSSAFQCNDMEKIAQLTKGLPVNARGSLRSIVDKYQRQRPFGITPLISAILHENVHVVKMLIRETTDMGQHLDKGFCRINDMREIEALYVDASMQIFLGPTEDIFKNFNQTTPMFWALKVNNLSIMEKILKCPRFKKNLPVEKLSGMPALMLAVSEDNIPACQLLLKYKVDLHVADFDGGRALDLAINRKLDDMIRFLLTNGENANCTKHLQPPIIHAIETDSSRVMKILIEKGVNIGSALVRNSSMRPLQYAVATQNFKVAKYLVENGAVVNARENNGVTALQILSKLKPEGPVSSKMSVDILDMAKFLVTHKADVNAQNVMKETALFIAINNMNVKLVKYLLSVNADVNVKNNSLQTPLHAAIIPSNATTAVVTMTPQTEITRTVAGGLTVNTHYTVPNQREVVNLLIESGADMKSKDRNLHTPLFLAVGNNNLEMVELFISLGSDVNAKNIDGLTLLHFATRQNNLNIVKCLIYVGKANVDVASNIGETPLHIAVFNQFTDIVECLINAKANVRVGGNRQPTPLGMAVGNNSSKLIKLLVKAGADVNSQLPNGSSYLHLALEFHHRKSAKCLLELGANVNISNEHGVTPFIVTVIDLEYKCEFIQLLLDYGADPMHPCRTGLTGYQYATTRHEVDLLKILWRHRCPTDEPVIKNHSADRNFKIKGELLFRNHITSVFCSNTPITDEEKALRTAQSSFMEGIVQNDPKKVEDAIQNGAVARGVSRSIKYPLHYAVKNGYQEVAEVLLTNGVQANSVDDNQQTPLGLAALAVDLAMCLALLSHGACYYPGLASYKGICLQVKKGGILLLNKEKNTDKTNELVGNQSTRRDKQAKGSKELNKQIKGRNRCQKQKKLKGIKQDTDPHKNKRHSNCKVLKEDVNLMFLFLVINKYFLLIKKCDRRHNIIAMRFINKCFENESVPFCKSLMNSVDKKGNTIMGAAIEAGNVEMTEYLMKLRLQHSKMTASDWKD